MTQGGVWGEGVAPGVSDLHQLSRPAAVHALLSEGGATLVPSLSAPTTRPPLPGLSGANR